MKNMKLIPILTEKSLQQKKEGFYAFWVDTKMDKKSIKKVVEKVFEVHVISVRTINFKGGQKRSFRGQIQKIKARKKALVALKDGESIDLFEEKAARRSGGKK